MIKPDAGRMRGVRVMRDPDGVLLDPFVDDSGTQYGYVVVYGEGSPAVHDGDTWHLVSDIPDEEWESKLHELIVDQGKRISKAAETSPIYAELAKILNVAVAPTVSAPTDTVITWEPKG